MEYKNPTEIVMDCMGKECQSVEWNKNKDKIGNFFLYILVKPLTHVPIPIPFTWLENNKIN